MKLLSHAALDHARQVGDAPADSVARSLGREAWTVNAVLRHAHKNGDALPEAVPSAVRALFDEGTRLPAWADRARLERAQRWASRHLFGITTALFCASLPTAYGAARGARVLAATGRMQRATLDRRVNETAQFVLDVVAEDALEPEGSMLRSLQKVRLLHASVRAHLEVLRFCEDEVPINQEDLLGTLFTFSVVVLRSLERLGVVVEPEQAEDYYHLWRCAGAMLGVEEALLPLGFRGACDLADRIAARQVRGSEHGRALMSALLERMEAHVPALASAPRALVRHLIGDGLADELGVPKDHALEAKLALFKMLPRGLPLASLARGLASRLGRPLLQSVVAVKLGGALPTFEMQGPRVTAAWRGSELDGVD